MVCSIILGLILKNQKAKFSSQIRNLRRYFCTRYLPFAFRPNASIGKFAHATEHKVLCHQIVAHLQENMTGIIPILKMFKNCFFLAKLVGFLSTFFFKIKKAANLLQKAYQSVIFCRIVFSALTMSFFGKKI